MLGLRRHEGVPDAWIPAETAGEYVRRGLATRTGGRFALTDRGMLVANDVILAVAG